MNTYEFENNRLIKAILQQLGINEDALAKEVGVTLAELMSWKRGEEIPAHCKRKLQHFSHIAESAHKFQSIMDKLGKGLGEQSLFDFLEQGEIYSEEEAGLLQALRSAANGAGHDFALLDCHTHYTILVIRECIESDLFSAYVSQTSPSEYQLFPDFINAFVSVSRIYYDWVRMKNRSSDLDVLDCEQAHLIVEIIIKLSFVHLIQSGFDSDYDGEDEAYELQEDVEEAIGLLVECSKARKGQIQINYYKLLDSIDDIIEEMEMSENGFPNDELMFEDDDSDFKIEKHFSLETKAILSEIRHSGMIEEFSVGTFFELVNQNKALVAQLFSATQELDRISKELANNTSTGDVKVKSAVLKKCKSALKQEGLEI